MNILISNDDGVNAVGIRKLHAGLVEHFNLTVVAPMTERSTTGHTLSLDHPLRLATVDEDIYGCSGFPADCVLMGIGHLCRDEKPDLVVSGINRGANLGQDIYYSGTVAAAREAAFHGIPAIAISLHIKKSSDPTYFENAANFALKIIKQKIHKYIPDYTLLNINVPNIPADQIKGVAWSPMGIRDYSEGVDCRVDSRDRNYYWISGILRGHVELGGTDCEMIERNYITVTAQNLVPEQKRDFSQVRDIVENL